MAKYSIGVDYGTLSARALMVNLTDGSEVAESVCEYSHAILTGDFFDWFIKNMVPESYMKEAKEASEIISDKCEKVYYPNPENTKKYEEIYKEYRELSEYFVKRKGV